MADRCKFELSLTVGLRRLARWSSGRARRDRCEVDRCRFVDRWLSFFLCLIGRIGALGGWIDRGLWIVGSHSFSRSLAGLELWVVGSIGALALDLARWLRSRSLA